MGETIAGEQESLIRSNSLRNINPLRMVQRQVHSVMEHRHKFHATSLRYLL